MHWHGWQGMRYHCRPLPSIAVHRCPLPPNSLHRRSLLSALPRIAARCGPWPSMDVDIDVHCWPLPSPLPTVAVGIAVHCQLQPLLSVAVGIAAIAVHCQRQSTAMAVPMAFRGTPQRNNFLHGKQIWGVMYWLPIDSLFFVLEYNWFLLFWASMWPAWRRRDSASCEASQQMLMHASSFLAVSMAVCTYAAPYACTT